MIIGVNGYAGSGKDAVGIIIQYLNCYNKGDISVEEAIRDYKHHECWLEDQSGWEIKKYAGKLKQIATLLTGISIENFEDQEYKKTNLSEEWNIHGMPMTVREFLQNLGTDALRDGLHTNTWMNALMADYTCVPADRAPGGWDCDNWVITDVRFPNEAKAIKNKGGIIIRVDRPGVKPVNPHPSETSLDGWEFDEKIGNVSDLICLAFTVETILKTRKIIL
jgi:hypothetical protein